MAAELKALETLEAEDDVAAPPLPDSPPPLPPPASGAPETRPASPPPPPPLPAFGEAPSMLHPGPLPAFGEATQTTQMKTMAETVGVLEAKVRQLENKVQAIEVLLSKVPQRFQ